MKKTKLLGFLLSAILLFGSLCSCNYVPGPRGPQGEAGPQGDPGPAGKDGASFLTGKGLPSNDLGNIGDSYLDLSGEEWGFYLKGENGWELLGYLETEPAPLTIDDLKGSYALSHVVSGTNVYKPGDSFAGLILSENMIRAELQDEGGILTVNMVSVASTRITCTVEQDKLIMSCEDVINITGQPSNVFQLSIVRDGDIYLVLEAYGDDYYVKKIG